MIEHTDADKLADFAQSVRHGDVLAARGRVPRGVVVHEQDRRGAVADRCTEDFAGVDQARIEGPDGDPMACDRAVLGVERNDMEFFLHAIGGQSRESSGAVSDRVIAAADAFGENRFDIAHRSDPAAQFDSRHDLAVAVASHRFGDRFEFLEARIDQPRQSPFFEARRECQSSLDCRLAWDSDANQDCQQLRVGQFFNSQFEQLLSGAVGKGYGFDLLAIDLFFDPMVDFTGILDEPFVVGLFVFLARLQVPVFGQLLEDLRDVSRSQIAALGFGPIHAEDFFFSDRTDCPSELLQPHGAHSLTLPSSDLGSDPFCPWCLF